MRLMTAMTLILMLAACADSKPGWVVTQEQQRQIKGLQERYESDLASPSFAILAGKVDLHLVYRSGEPICAGSAQDRLPSLEERAALRRWAELRENYVDRYEAIVMKEPDGSTQVKSVANRFDAVMDNGLRSESQLISALAEGRLTYCRFTAQDRLLTEGVLREAHALSDKFREARGLDYQLSHRDQIGNPYLN